MIGRVEAQGHFLGRSVGPTAHVVQECSQLEVFRPIVGPHDDLLGRHNLLVQLQLVPDVHREANIVLDAFWSNEVLHDVLLLVVLHPVHYHDVILLSGRMDVVVMLREVLHDKKLPLLQLLPISPILRPLGLHSNLMALALGQLLVVAGGQFCGVLLSQLSQGLAGRARNTLHGLVQPLEKKSVVEGALLVALVALLLQPAVVVVKKVHLGLAERTILPPRQNWAGDLDEHDEAQLLAEPSALHRVPLDSGLQSRRVGNT
mmetsp:Transcript_817/g.2979  ORF Transcript_817/g.2979 Transcript_817/m.2979 type:complete len:260 (-) Transcript_817:750-1529(-)